MPEPLAIVGAVNGTAALVIAARREVLASRRRLVVEHAWHLALSRKHPVELRAAWVAVMIINAGGRSMAVEHLGWEVAERVEGAKTPGGAGVAMLRRGEVPLDEPIELQPDAASRKVWTPIGPLLRLGLDPFDDPVWPVAFTTQERLWRGRPTELIPPDRLPVDLTRARAEAGLQRLRDEAEEPPDVGDGLFSLQRDDPYLPED